jgi:hypothetical protein
MTHKAKPAPAKVKVRVFIPFILSGGGESFGPNAVVEVDAAEAKRLIDLGGKVAD